jgi:DNA polymerase-1
VDLVDNFDRESILAQLEHFLSTRVKLLVLHNAPYDLSVIKKVTNWLPTCDVFDTMTAAHLLDEEGSKALKNLAPRYLKVPEDQIQKYEAVSQEDRHGVKFTFYAQNDALWTYQLWEVFKPKLVHQGLDKLFYKIETPFQKTLVDFRTNGILVDQMAMKEFAERIRADVLVQKQKLYDLAGWGYHLQRDLFGGPTELVSGKNINSEMQVLQVLLKEGLKITEKTDKGAPSLGKKTKQALKSKSEFVRLWDIYEKNVRLLDGFLTPLPGFIDPDGRVRPNLTNTVTVTGRLSCRDPNMQNTPKKTEAYEGEFRSLFIASPGCSLVVGDYAGQELRVAAHVSQDSRLIRVFTNSFDPHLCTANAVFKLDIPVAALCTKHPDYEKYKKKFKYERDVGKNGVNFAIVYGTTPVGMAANLNITEAKAKEYIDTFYETYPGVKRAVFDVIKQVNSRGFVKSLTGRRRRLEAHKARSFRQGFNFIIQGLCADMVRKAATGVRRLFLQNPHWGGKLLLTVHDELVSEIKDEFVEEAKPQIKRVMENAMRLSVPMEVDINSGKRYSEAK